MRIVGLKAWLRSPFQKVLAPDHGLGNSRSGLAVPVSYDDRIIDDHVVVFSDFAMKGDSRWTNLRSYLVNIVHAIDILG
jgi:hypothetical protein